MTWSAMTSDPRSLASLSGRSFPALETVTGRLDVDYNDVHGSLSRAAPLSPRATLGLGKPLPLTHPAGGISPSPCVCASVSLPLDPFSTSLNPPATVMTQHVDGISSAAIVDALQGHRRELFPFSVCCAFPSLSLSILSVFSLSPLSVYPLSLFPHSVFFLSRCVSLSSPPLSLSLFPLYLILFPLSLFLFSCFLSLSLSFPSVLFPFESSFLSVSIFLSLSLSLSLSGFSYVAFLSFLFILFFSPIVSPVSLSLSLFLSLSILPLFLYRFLSWLLLFSSSFPLCFSVPLSFF